MEIKGKMPQMILYYPESFKPVWEKYNEILRRDKKKASREIRRFIEAEVYKRDPGNPQRPIGAFIEGHEDKERLKIKNTIEALFNFGSIRGNEIERKFILSYLRENKFMPKRIEDISLRIIKDLKEKGIKILY